MKNLTARPRYLAAILVLCSPLLCAQNPQLKTPSEAGPPTTLSPSLKRDIVPGRKLTIVTQNKPLLRQTCKVEQFDDEKLVCRGKSGPATYSEKDLVAVIAADHEFGLPKPLKILATLGLSGGALAGAALLASIPTAGIPLAVVGAVLLIGSIFDSMDSDGTGPRERLLYLNPGQRLQIDLK